MIRTLKRHPIPEPALDARRKEMVALLERLRAGLERETPALSQARDLALYSYLYYLNHKREDPHRARRPLGHYHDYLPRVRSSSRRLRRFNRHLREIAHALSAGPDEARLARLLDGCEREILAEGASRLPEIGALRRALERVLRTLKEVYR